MSSGLQTAYFSMEVALESGIPTYSGGLGVLAGDTIRSAADLGLGFTAVTLLHRKGFFLQRLGPSGEQIEAPDPWQPENHLEEVPTRVSIDLEHRSITVRAWRYLVRGRSGATVPVYLLDTDLPANLPEDRRLTDDLYLGDDRTRLRQEAVLGLGGAALLDALGLHFDHFHLNEGHAALVGLALIERFRAMPGPVGRSASTALNAVRASCVFTTHTPVPAGHDRFDQSLARSVLGDARCEVLAEIGVKDELNMTELALACSQFVNGVAVRHGEVSRSMFPGYPVRSITNGVHPGTWISPAMKELFDLYIPSWQLDPFALRYASQIPAVEIGIAHGRSKKRLFDFIRRETARVFDPDALTIGFARRATGYKRTTLVFHDLERLARIAERHGPIQLVFSGKAHPYDEEGKSLIRHVFDAARQLGGRIEVVYLPNYGMDLGLLLVSGVDVWLNNPIPPLEASGTSGMKAAMNGVPSLSILDGWWVEGCIEGVTGWEIEDGLVDVGEHPQRLDANHAEGLYRKLDEVVAPLYFNSPEEFLKVRRHAISLNGSFFNTHRMVLQYVQEAYLAD